MGLAEYVVGQLLTIKGTLEMKTLCVQMIDTQITKKSVGGAS